MPFEDHFSHRASTYARFRPGYPRELFAWLAGLAPTRRLAWDCATGSGQAALGLAEYFEQVVATDASQEQIDQAAPHPRIHYRVEPAEETSLYTASADLAAAATAVHWFKLDLFFAEVRRVLVPGGVVAVWTYHRPQITPQMDAAIARLEVEILGSYWPQPVRLLQEHYRTLPFPFEELDPPEFTIEARWSLEQMLGFINSWSAVKRFEEERGFHPLEPMRDDFLAAWGSEESEHAIRWPLYIRVGRVGQPGRAEGV